MRCSRIASRRPGNRCSSGMVPLSKNSSISASLPSATISTIFSWPSLAAAAKEGHEKIVEMVAEGNDALMEEFFDKGTIPDEHLLPGLRDAIREHRMFPLLYTSGLGNI